MKRMTMTAIIMATLGISVALYATGCAKSTSDTPTFTLHSSTSAT